MTAQSPRYPDVITGTTITRPANTTAYASGQLVANSVTAGSVVPIAFDVVSDKTKPRSLTRVRLEKSGTVLTNASFRLHLYRRVMVCANGDGAAWSTDSALYYLGFVDITIDKAMTDGSIGVAAPAANIAFQPADNTSLIYGLLEARAAYTPISAEVFTATLEIQ